MFVKYYSEFWSWYVVSHLPCIPSAKKRWRWAQSGVREREGGLFSHAKDRQWSRSSVEPRLRFHCCASGWFGVIRRVCVCVRESFVFKIRVRLRCSLIGSFRPLTQFKSWAETGSPPHGWRWRSSSHHCWMQNDRKNKGYYRLLTL